MILHAITPFGPLCERDERGIPVSDLRWNGDTPLATKRIDNKLTCQSMWKATSSSGDYHDNMNSEMFMKWTSEKLVPTFEKLTRTKRWFLYVTTLHTIIRERSVRYR